MTVLDLVFYRRLASALEGPAAGDVPATKPFRPKDTARAAEHLRRAWEDHGTLYGKDWYERNQADLASALEANGHLSPARVPPSDLAAGVARGGFGSR